MLIAIFAVKLDANFKTNVENVVEQNVTALYDDSLLSALLNPRIIKTCLDLVQENITAPKIKVVEVGASRGNLFTKFMPLLNSQPLTTVR